MPDHYWVFNARDNSYSPSKTEPLSAFPTIVDAKNMRVFCRLHHGWEPIAAFNKNVLKSGCGKLYAGPFRPEHALFNYGYEARKMGEVYLILVHSQTVELDRRRLIDERFELNVKENKLYKELIELYRTAFIYTTDPVNLEKIGDIQAILKNYNEAIDSYLSFAEINGPTTNIYDKLANLFEKINDESSKLACIEQKKMLEDADV